MARGIGAGLAWGAGASALAVVGVLQFTDIREIRMPAPQVGTPDVPPGAGFMRAREEFDPVAPASDAPPAATGGPDGLAGPPAPTDPVDALEREAARPAADAPSAPHFGPPPDQSAAITPPAAPGPARPVEGPRPASPVAPDGEVRPGDMDAVRSAGAVPIPPEAPGAATAFDDPLGERPAAAGNADMATAPPSSPEAPPQEAAPGGLSDTGTGPVRTGAAPLPPASLDGIDAGPAGPESLNALPEAPPGAVRPAAPAAPVGETPPSDPGTQDGGVVAGLSAGPSDAGFGTVDHGRRPVEPERGSDATRPSGGHAPTPPSFPDLAADARAPGPPNGGDGGTLPMPPSRDGVPRPVMPEIDAPEGAGSTPSAARIGDRDPQSAVPAGIAAPPVPESGAVPPPAAPGA